MPQVTYRLLIEYDGAPFAGWQRQAGVATVQQTLEEALETALRTPAVVTGAGRTDAGVHARGQVAHFVTAHAVDVARLRRSLNGILPVSVAVLALEPVPDAFHARFDARGRRYRYHASTVARPLDAGRRLLLPRGVDFERMNMAARTLLGVHHFGAFCRIRSETRNRVCAVKKAEWQEEDRKGDWHFEIIADRFLHGMVRSIVGTLLEIGRGKREPYDLERILASRDRREAGPAVPAHGLVLEGVTY